MRKNSNVTLKDFTETCNKLLERCSNDELKQIILEMADKVSIGERQRFIDSLARGKTVKNKPLAAEIDAEIIEEIEDIKSEILETASEEPDWENYDDEDSLCGYEQFVEPLAEIFDKVEASFDYGNYDIARKAYEMLFPLFEMEDDYGRGIRIDDLSTVDLVCVRAKYLCSIYLTEQGDQRSSILLSAMRESADLDSATSPKLADIINVAPIALPDLQSFLTEWLDAIATISKEDPACHNALLREAIFLHDGNSGLEKLALSSGDKNPRVYVDWINSLIDNSEYEKALHIVNMAFEKLSSEQPIKAAIADLMVRCGQKISDPDVIRNGLWFSFENKPSLNKLIDIYEQSDSSKRKTTIFRAAQCVEKYLKQPCKYDRRQSWESDDIEMPAILDTCLLLHNLLLAEEEDHAWQIAKKGDPLGWSSSSNPQPLFLSYYLIRTMKCSLDKLPNYLDQLWQKSLQTSAGINWFSQAASNSTLQRLKCIYKEIFVTAATAETEIFNWCLTAAENRVCSIVSNQHRGAYERAALVVGACTEVLKVTNPKNMMDFFNRIKLKFPRHSAFQTELKRLVFE